MRFGTIDGRAIIVSDQKCIDLSDASDGRLPSDPIDALARFNEVREFAAAVDWTRAQELDESRLGPPVPNPRQVFAIALNYAPHAAEAGYVAPTEPLVFTKFPTCITGPDVSVELPPGHVDWEIEVVAVVGAGGRDIARGHAWDALAGLTCGQDLSERVIQLTGRPAQFSLGKSFAGFGPIGPVVVTPDEFADRNDIGFASFLDGEPLQSGRTGEMIFAIDELVARISTICALLPGDLIFTGTPAGVGNRMDPPRFLQPGQTLVSQLEQVGQIRQTFTGSPSTP